MGQRLTAYKAIPKKNYNPRSSWLAAKLYCNAKKFFSDLTAKKVNFPSLFCAGQQFFKKNNVFLEKDQGIMVSLRK
jgi:hypothetical protein